MPDQNMCSECGRPSYQAKLGVLLVQNAECLSQIKKRDDILQKHGIKPPVDPQADAPSKTISLAWKVAAGVSAAAGAAGALYYFS